MTQDLNQLLKKAYHHYQDDPNPPLPLDIIKEHLEAEGISVDKK